MDFPHTVIVAMAVMVFPLLYLLLMTLDRFMRPHEKKDGWAISPDTKYPSPPGIDVHDPDKKWYQP